MFLCHFDIMFYYFVMLVHTQQSIIMAIKKLELILRKIWIYQKVMGWKHQRIVQ